MENKEQAYKDEFAARLKSYRAEKPLPVELPDYPPLQLPPDVLAEWEKPSC